MALESLTIRREGQNTAWNIWPVMDAIPPGAIQESCNYIIELQNSPDAMATDVFVDGDELEGLRSREPTTAVWRWSPGFHAGVIQIQLKFPHKKLIEIEFVTDPAVRKMARQDFDIMVKEILQDTFALFSYSSFKKGISQSVSNTPPPIARMEFLYSRLLEIEKAVTKICSRPRAFLGGEETLKPYHKVKKMIGVAFLKSYRGGNVELVNNPKKNIPSIFPRMIKTTHHNSQLDIPEHRQVKACLLAWANWTHVISDVLSRETTSKSRNIQIWMKKMRRVSRALLDLSNHSFFVDIKPTKPSLKLTPIFRQDPNYRIFFRLYQEMNLGLASIFGDFLQMPLARTFDLYELWCFLRLARAAVEKYGENSVEINDLFIEGQNGKLISSPRALKIKLGVINLFFQKQYREYWEDTERQGSFSRYMTPDVSIQGKRSGGQTSVVILDAKYRIASDLNDALTSIHTYRDALVKEADGEIDGIVKGAYLLTPHIPNLVYDFKETKMPNRLFHPSYRAEFKFGAFTLKPGTPFSDITKIFDKLLGDLS